MQHFQRKQIILYGLRLEQLVTSLSLKLFSFRTRPQVLPQEIRGALLFTPEDIWSFRNVHLLSFNIERAFDTCQISFVPHPLRENSYYMKVWNDKVRDVLIWDEAEVSEAGTKDNTIGHYENHLLNLEMRSGGLSYQNFICFYKSPVREEAVDFSSELDPNE